jgi:hypothetical protein
MIEHFAVQLPHEKSSALNRQATCSSQRQHDMMSNGLDILAQVVWKTGVRPMNFHPSP